MKRVDWSIVLEVKEIGRVVSVVLASMCQSGDIDNIFAPLIPEWDLEPARPPPKTPSPARLSNLESKSGPLPRQVS
jgi:hypothetical protein